MNKKKTRMTNKKKSIANKRKAEDDESESEMKRQVVGAEDGSSNTNSSDCGNGICGNSLEDQNLNNGDASEKPESSVDANSTDGNCISLHETTEQKENHSGNKGGNKGGVLLFSGGTNWDLIGRKQLPKTAKGAVGPNLWGPHKLSALRGIRVAFIASGSTACHSVIVTDEGRTMTWGRNEKGQLGHCDTVRKDNPCIVEHLKEQFIISAACGRSHTLFLSDKGIVYSCGDNRMGQCGTGSQNDTINIPTEISFTDEQVNKVACGAEFSAIVDSKGALYTFGSPEYGQLGHNTDGKYFITSSKLSFRFERVPRRVIAYIEKTREGRAILVDDVQIVEVACGTNHSVAVDTKNRCFTWGFGGYGRLGHSEPKDELIPRLVKTFDGPKRGVKHVSAGSTFSMAINEFDVLYFWGQTKSSGEATMYPKPIHDLNGWKVRQVACSNTSIVAVADESVVAWGPSPAYGELCYGENHSKSSCVPKQVDILDGLHIIDVACGVGHTLLIARDETDEDSAKLLALPEFSP